eukprot:TRINITY_DN3398_c0_g1_i1.p4 TRINITY_DN3398_c0_g1~~TRINITY_DN3398_c0_g1_i1.p4  ORF type:complete len:107 (+),score=15.96 TRINITY_DN3398_c0_g1_i1:722-1042(+)
MQRSRETHAYGLLQLPIRQQQPAQEVSTLAQTLTRLTLFKCSLPSASLRRLELTPEATRRVNALDTMFCAESAEGEGGEESWMAGARLVTNASPRMREGRGGGRRS